MLRPWLFNNTCIGFYKAQKYSPTKIRRKFRKCKLIVVRRTMNNSKPCVRCLKLIEDIGIRSTKIRDFDNKQIIIPNGVMANAKIINYVKESYNYKRKYALHKAMSPLDRFCLVFIPAFLVSVISMIILGLLLISNIFASLNTFNRLSIVGMATAIGLSIVGIGSVISLFVDLKIRNYYFKKYDIEK